ncbi:hypothetical protein ACIPM0_07565 [Pseudomonas sichuanensis]|uniref:hypothetical protein n=1 Tax=Pseudomonas sichuanensis TaxID=2213015 RepID=UPI003828186F
MRYQDTINHLSKVLNDQQAEVSTEANELLEILAEENLGTKRQKAKQTAKAIDELTRLLPEKDIPESLNNLRISLLNYHNGSIDGKALINILITALPQLKNQRWLGDDSMVQGFDFEDIFAQCRNDSKIPELFDSIIDLLGEIRDSGELDSRSMIDALSKLISTLHIGKSTTCFSLDGAWQFLCNFLENYFWAEAKKIPALGGLVEALETTLKETNIEIMKLHTKVHSEMTTRVTEQVRLFQKNEDSIFRVYGKSGALTLECPDSSQRYKA